MPATSNDLSLGTIRPEFMAQLRADMAMNQPRDKQGQFASTGSGGGLSISPIPAPPKGQQTIQHAAGVLSAQGIRLTPEGSKPNAKGEWKTYYKLTSASGQTQVVEAGELKKMIYTKSQGA